MIYGIVASQSVKRSVLGVQFTGLVLENSEPQLSFGEPSFQQLPQERVVIFRDDFTGSGALRDHLPNINLLNTAPWKPSDRNPLAWNTGTTPPDTLVSGGSMLVQSDSDAVYILDPGNDTTTHDPVDPPDEAYQGSFTLTFKWRSPRSASQDQALTGYGYPIQISAGKSDVTLDQGYRSTIGFSLSGNDGSTEKKLFIYGGVEQPVVNYLANNDYEGTLVVGPGTRELHFLGQVLHATVTDETEAHLIMGPIYMHMGENCTLDFVQLETGMHPPSEV